MTVSELYGLFQIISHFRTVSQPSGFFQIISPFLNGVKTVQIFLDHFTFSGRFQYHLDCLGLYCPVLYCLAFYWVFGPLEVGSLYHALHSGLYHGLRRPYRAKYCPPRPVAHFLMGHCYLRLSAMQCIVIAQIVGGRCAKGGKRLPGSSSLSPDPASYQQSDPKWNGSEMQEMVSRYVSWNYSDGICCYTNLLNIFS